MFVECISTFTPPVPKVNISGCVQPITMENKNNYA